MEKKLTTNDVESLLSHVIITIDRWWVENTNCKKGNFTRLIIYDSPVTYKEYVEWRYSELPDYKDYVSIFISLELEYGEDCINIAFKTMKDGVYTEYDPFCEICEGKTEAVFSEQTGFDSDNIMHDVLTDQDIYVLTNTIADTVHKFVTPPDEDKPAEYDDADSDMAFDSCSATEYAMNHEEKVSVNMDDVSKTLSIHDIQDCMIKAMRIMIVDRDTVNELTRLGSEYFVHDLSPTKCKDMLGYKINVTPKNVVTRIVYGDAYTLCIFTCEPDMYGQHEFIIRYNSCDTGFQYKQGFNILYKNPDDYCFEYAGDGFNVEKVFKPFVDILRNTLNYELYQQLTKSNEEEAKKQQQEKIAELLEKTCAELDYRKNVMTCWTQRHEFASVVESIISETLDQFCSPEYDRQHELFHQCARDLMQNIKIDPDVINHSRYSYTLTTGDNNASLKFDIVADGELTRQYSFETSPVMIASVMVESHDCKSPLGYCGTTDIILQSHFDGHKEPKEVTTICQLQRGDDGAIQLIRCFDPIATCGQCICEKLFLAFHAVIGHSVAAPAVLQETYEEAKEETMDTETKAPAIKAGLMPKEVFVLDTSYFVVGDIYLLEIDPVYDWSRISTTPIKVPRHVYAICKDVCSKVIHFMLGGITGHDQLFMMPVHADEIESGLITVKRVLMNESLIQNEDEGCNGYER